MVHLKSIAGLLAFLVLALWQNNVSADATETFMKNRIKQLSDRRVPGYHYYQKKFNRGRRQNRSTGLNASILRGFRRAQSWVEITNSVAGGSNFGIVANNCKNLKNAYNRVKIKRSLILGGRVNTGISARKCRRASGKYKNRVSIKNSRVGR